MSTVYHRPADPSGDDSYLRPLFADRCQAGFPSPATDYAEQELDLNSYCISRPAATFFLRASGESMNQAGVQNGDLLVVDRAEKPQHGDIVIAEIDGEFTVKRLLLRPRPALEPVSDSPEFRTLYPENICIQIIAPLQCSQPDLDTLTELEQQIDAMHNLNPELKVYCLQSMATTNPVLRGNERKEFLEYLEEFPTIQVLDSVICFRKVYRDCMSNGTGVVETNNTAARAEIEHLMNEVFGPW